MLFVQVAVLRIDSPFFFQTRGEVVLPKTDTNEVNQLSFEASLHKMTSLVEQLESGQMSLEDSVHAFEQGVQLSRRCEALLDQAEQRLDILHEQD